MIPGDTSGELVLRCVRCGRVLTDILRCPGCGSGRLRGLREDERRAWDSCECAGAVMPTPDTCRAVMVRCGMEG